MAGEAFDPKAFLAEPDEETAPFDPKAFLAEPDEPVATPEADQVGFDPPRPNFVTTPEYQQQRDAENESFRSAVELAQTSTEGDDLTAFRISQKLGVAAAEVKKNLPTFKSVEATTDFDPDAWRADAPPEFKRLILRNPSLAPVLVKTEVGGKISGILKLMAGAVIEGVMNPVDVLDYAFGMPSRVEDFSHLDSGSEIVSTLTALDLVDESKRLEGMVADPALSAIDQARAREDLAKLAPRLDQAKGIIEKTKSGFRPHTVMQLDDAAAQAARAPTGPWQVGEDPIARTETWRFAMQRGKEISAGLEESRLRIMRRWSKKMGASEDELRDYNEKIDTLSKESQQRFLGEGEAGQIFGIAEQGIISTAQSMPLALERAGEFGVAGAVVGGALGSKTPLGARAGAIAGMKAMAKAGALFGATESSFFVEAGSTDKELEAVVTDDKKHLTDDQILAGAVFAGTIKAGMETLETVSMLKTLGPGLSGAIERFFSAGGPRALVKEHLVDPGFRAALARAGGRLALSAWEEGSEEVGQTATDDITRYFLKSLVDRKLQVGSIFNKSEWKDSFLGGALGGLLMGSFGTTAGFISDVRQQTATERAVKQVDAAFQLASNEASKAAPDQVADAFREATTRGGQPVTALHVDGPAIVKYYQDQGKTGAETNAAIAELLGKDAPGQLLDAVSTPGGKLEIPMARVLSHWGESDIGKALKDDTTTAAHLDSPRKTMRDAAQVETDAIALAEQEARKFDESQLMQDRTAAVIQQLTSEGQTREQARTVASLIAHFVRTMSKDFGKTEAEVFPQTPITFGAGDESGTTTSADPLIGLTKNFTPEERATKLFTDEVTGLRNRRAWDAEPRQPGKLVAAVTLTDAKAINDHPSGGHDTTNDAFTKLGAVVGSIDPEAARSGTTFLFHAKDQAELDTALQLAREAMPQGLSIEGALAQDTEAAFTALDKSTDTKRLPGPNGEAPLLPARGSTKFDTSTLEKGPFKGSTPAKANISPALLERARKTEGAAFVNEALRDRDIPGLMSRTGFETAGENAYVSAYDLRGLKLANEKHGKAVGDKLIHEFGMAMLRAGGAAMKAAHFSGDEYAAGASNRAALERFNFRLAAELDRVEIPVTVDGETTTIRPKFRSGIGEKTYGAADQALNTAKRAELAAAGNVGGAVGGALGSAPGSEGVSRTDAPAPAGEGAAVDSGALGSDGQVPDWVTEDVDQHAADVIADREANGALRSEEAEAIRQGFNLPEAITSARADIKEFRAKAKNALAGETAQGGIDRLVAAKQRLNERQHAAEAFIKWVENTGPGLAEEGVVGQREGAMVVSKELKRETELFLRNEYNIIDPQSGLSSLTEDSAAGIDADLRRAKRAAAKTAYDRAKRGDARLAFATHVQGRVMQEARKGPGVREKWRESFVAPALRRLEWSRLARRTADQSITFKDRLGQNILLSPAREGVGGARASDKWRVTYFANGEPAGHTFAENHREAMSRAREYGALPESAVVAKSATRLAQQKTKIHAFNWSSGKARVHAFHGPADGFASQDDASVIMSAFTGNVMWLETIEADRGAGADGMAELERFAKANNIGAIGLQVVPMPDSDAGRVKVEQFYRNHGFERSGLAPWSEYQVMVKVLDPAAVDSRSSFDPSNPGQRLFQTDEKDTPENAPKGYTEIPELRQAQDAIRVFLNKSADTSTVLHETAHAFLEHLGDLAERADAPQRTKDTYAAALKWMGVATREEVKREHHEKFARSFEAYLLEGKAPVASLAGAFQKFKLWLTGIYRSIMGIPGQEINEDVRKVFDALLATEDEIESFQKQQGAEHQVRDPALSEAQWKAKLEEQRELASELNRKAELHALKDRLRVTEKWWKDGIRKAEKEAADEYEDLPGRRAQRILQGDYPGLEGPVVMEKARVDAAIGKARAAGIRTAKVGVNPDSVAELSDHGSGAAMLKDVLELQPKDSWVRDTAKARMEAAHPDVLTDRKELRELVSDALSKYTEKRLLAEGVIKGAEMATIKRAAELLVERREMSKLDPSLALTRERSAAKAKATANAKGDWTATHQAARDEALNAALYRGLLDAREERAKIEERSREMGKSTALAKLGKASPLYRDAVVYLLEATGQRKPGAVPLTDAALSAAVDQMNGDATAIGDPDWLGPVRAALSRIRAAVRPGEEVNLRKMTVAEGRQLMNALKQVQASARQRTTVTDGINSADKEQVVAEALTNIASTLPPKGPIAEKHARWRSEKLRVGINRLDGFLLSPIDMVRDLVGDDQETALWKYIVNPLRRAAYREADLMKETVKPIIEAMERIPKEMRDHLSDKIDGHAMFKTHIENQGLTVPRYRYEILMMALNSGNEGNLTVLLEGRKISPEEHQTALNMLTKEEIDWVNAVIETTESLREPAFALEERETGLRPEAVKPRPMRLTNGELRGGYFPLKSIRDASDVGQRAAGGDMAQLFDPTYSRPVTSHGHLKSRTGAVYPLSLDPNIIMQHLGAVTHDIAFREAVKSVAGLVIDKDIAAALRERLGAPKASEFLQWLKDIGGGTRQADNALNDMAAWVRSNMATSLLSGLSTAVGNFANYPTAIASTKLQSKHLAAGMAQLGAAMTFKSALGIEDNPQRILALEKSGMLRQMDNDLVAGLAKEMSSLTADKFDRGLEWVKEAGMAAMRGVDTNVTTAVWLGAYRQALAEKMEEGAAVRFADDIVAQVQPSSSNVEKAGILRDKRGIGALVMFYGYLSVAYRAQHRIASPLMTQEFADSSAWEKSKMAGKVAGSMLGFYVAYQVLGELLMGRGPEDGDRDEDEPDNALIKWRNWLARKLLVAPLSTIPILPLTQLVEGAILGKRVNPRADPLSGAALQLFKTGQVIYEAARKDGDPGQAISEALRSIGIFKGVPTRLIDTTGRYLWETTVGDRKVPNAGRALGGVLYGEKDKQPDNIPVLLGD